MFLEKFILFYVTRGTLVKIDTKLEIRNIMHLTTAAQFINIFFSNIKDGPFVKNWYVLQRYIKSSSKTPQEKVFSNILIETYNVLDQGYLFHQYKALFLQCYKGVTILKFICFAVVWIWQRVWTSPRKTSSREGILNFE